MATRKKIMDITERLDNPDMTFDAVDEAIREIKRLRTERDALVEALRRLVDVQNGPPLLSHKTEWEYAMFLSNRALSIGDCYEKAPSP